MNHPGIKDVLKIVYLPEWNTHAYICHDGSIYVQLMLGHCFTKDEYLNSDLVPSFNKEFVDERLKMFEELEEYYNELAAKIMSE